MNTTNHKTNMPIFKQSMHKNEKGRGRKKKTPSVVKREEANMEVQEPSNVILIKDRIPKSKTEAITFSKIKSVYSQNPPILLQQKKKSFNMMELCKGHINTYCMN